MTTSTKAPKAPKAPKPVEPVISQIVSAYQNISTEADKSNQDGLDFISLVARLIESGKTSANGFKVSIKQAGINPLVPIKENHAEYLVHAALIIARVKGDLTVAKVLTLANRVKRSGYEVVSGDTFEELEKNVPTIKETTDAKKTDKVEDGAKVVVPTLDALVIGFVSELKKLSKGENIKTLKFDELTTSALEEMKVILGTISRNGLKK